VGVAREAEDVGHGVPVAADRINDVCISVDGVLILDHRQSVLERDVDAFECCSILEQRERPAASVPSPSTFEALGPNAPGSCASRRSTQ